MFLIFKFYLTMLQIFLKNQCSWCCAYHLERSVSSPILWESHLLEEGAQHPDTIFLVLLSFLYKPRIVTNASF